MKHKLLFLGFICLFLSANQVQAQITDSQWYHELSKGDWATDVMVGATTTSYDSSHEGGNWLGYTAQVDISYFFTNDLSAGFTFGAEYSLDKRTEEKFYNFGLVSKYHFTLDSNRVFPYVGGQFNCFCVDIEKQHVSPNHEYGWMYGPIFGVKYYYTTGISVFAEYQMRLFSGDVGNIIDSQNVGLVGLSFHF